MRLQRRRFSGQICVLRTPARSSWRGSRAPASSTGWR